MSKINLGDFDMYKLGIGYDDFKVMREEERYYIDKTNLIKDILNSNYQVMLFTRPRRFGKTLNLSMLRHFFDFKLKEENRKLFTNLNISKTKYMDTHFGEYPVIFISLKGIDTTNIKSLKKSLRIIIRNLYNQNKEILNKLDEFDSAYYKEYLNHENIENEKIDISSSLKQLMNFMYQVYGKKTILLIDEYDTPLQRAYVEGFYSDAIKILKNLFNETLKTNEYLEKAILTGILKISKEDMFSGLNNIEVNTILDENFSEYFGIEEFEVEKALFDYELESTITEVKKWYDGYIFGEKHIYNPWSLVNYLAKKELKAYWINTSSTDLIEDTLRKNESSLEDLKELLDKGSIEKRLDANTVIKDINDKSFELLFFSGYLTLDKHIEKNVYSLKIPNYEVETFFEDSFITRIFREEKYYNIMKYLYEKRYVEFEKELQKVFIENVSYHDLGSTEKFYHNVILGMLIREKNKCDIRSNRESGLGRSDIELVRKDTKECFILEFKVAKENQSLEEIGKLALEQIENKKYGFEYMKVNKIAIVFKGKELKVFSK